MGDDSYTSSDNDGFTVTGTLTVLADGSIAYTGDTLGTSESGQSWLDFVATGNGDPFHVRIVFVSGTDTYFTGDALNTWHAMTSNRTFQFRKLSAGGPDVDIGTYRIDVSDDGGSTTLDSNTFGITMSEASP